jgi:mannitol-1-phosphate 5-dehydrogenase
MEKLVLFGAGKIGRSFMGQLFSLSGFEVVFIDINKHLIDELNRSGKYKVVIKSKQDEVLIIKNVRGLYADNEEAISNDIYDARILAVSVGIKGLPEIIPVLAKSLMRRYEKGNKSPVDIIIAENMRNAAAYFHDALSAILPASYPLNKMVGLVETSIGKGY